MSEVKCAICGALIDTINPLVYHTEDDEWVCHHCRDRLTTCIVCGGVIIRNKHKIRCNRCENQIYKNDINSYGTKPYSIFKNSITKSNEPIKNVRYYGLEMEFNYTNPIRCRELGESLYNDKWIYNKRDGSISYGVEIVTSPMDLKSVKFLLNQMDNLKIFDYIKKNSEYKNNAGLHIHVSRNSIPIMDRYKLCSLLNSTCSKKEKKAIYYLSGRIKLLGSDIDSDGYFRVGGSDSIAPRLCGHSYALNTANDSTLEFRLFKSSAEKEVLLSYVEIVNKMLEFAHNFGIDDMTISNFILWLNNNTKNKIILNKILEIQNSEYKLCKINRVTYSKFDKIRGLNWKKYPALLGRINNLGIKRGLSFENLEEFSTSFRIELRDDDTEFEKQIKNTLRRTLIEYILQNQRKEEEQCA